MVPVPSPAVLSVAGMVLVVIGRVTLGDMGPDTPVVIGEVIYGDVVPNTAVVIEGVIVLVVSAPVVAWH